MKKLLLTIVILIPITLSSNYINFADIWSKLDFRQPEVIKFYITQKYPKIKHHIFRTIERESGYDIYADNPKSSAIGLGQITKACAKSEGYSYKEVSDNPIKNIDCCVSYLQKCLKKANGNYEQAYKLYKNGLYSI